MFAGVAHLVERDLAKVEVASSSLVARSKKKHHPSGWCFLFGMSRAGLNLLPRPARSALNQEVRQGSCEWLRHSWDAGSESSLVTFFAFAVCGDADNKSSGQSQRNTIPIGWCFFAFAGPPAMCSPSCRQHKSVVFLRRFCLARKMEQGNTIQLFVVLFLFPYNRCANGCTAADKQQGNPQSRAACVAGLGRFGIVLQLRRYGVGFFDFLCTVLVAEILATAFAVPVLDIALGGLGRRLCREVL